VSQPGAAGRRYPVPHEVVGIVAVCVAAGGRDPMACDLFAPLAEI
jgi:hypothetical protein